MIYFGDVKPSVVAPLQVNLDRSIGSARPHSVKIDLDFHSINTA
jgi:hypothetical protein